MKIVAIGAHFDDIEIGCGGTLLKLIQHGCEITAIVVASDGYTHYDGRVLRSNEEAYEEGRAACGALGVTLLTLGRKTKEVQCNHKLVESIESYLDSFSPDVIFSHWLGDLHEDHHETARAALLAARHYPSVLLYRSNWYHSEYEFSGRFYVDISDVVDRKIEILKLHKSEYSRRGEPWLDFVRSKAREAGLRMNVDYAEEFEVAKFLWSAYGCCS